MRKLVLNECRIVLNRLEILHIPSVIKKKLVVYFYFIMYRFTNSVKEKKMFRFMNLHVNTFYTYEIKDKMTLGTILFYHYYFR